MLLKLYNNTTHQEITFDVTDNNTSRLFYCFDITLPEDCDEGEVTYYLYKDNNELVATGLGIIGDFVPDNKTYTADTQNNYIVYNG